MADELVSQISRCYRTGKKVLKTLRVVKRPTAMGLLGIALGASGRDASRESATSRKQVGEKNKGGGPELGKKSQVSHRAGGEKSAQGV